MSERVKVSHDCDGRRPKNARRKEIFLRDERETRGRKGEGKGGSLTKQVKSMDLVIKRNFQGSRFKQIFDQGGLVRAEKFGSIMSACFGASLHHVSVFRKML